MDKEEEVRQYTTFEFHMCNFLKKYINKIVKTVQSRIAINFGRVK